MSLIENNIIAEAKIFTRRNKGFKIDKRSKKAFSYGSPRISSEFMDCSLPMTFDHYSFCSLGCIYCVPADTKILMADSIEKAICEIKEGELTITFNEESKRFEESEVTATMNREADEIIVLKIEDNISLEVSPEHPVLVKDKGWIAADNLSKDDEIMVWE